MEMQTELFLKLLIHVKRVTQGWGLLYHRFDLIMQEGKIKQTEHSLSRVYNMHTRGK